MNALHIIVDSTADMTLEEARSLGVSVMVLKVFFGPEGFRDKIDLIGEAFFEKLKASPVMPTTTMVTPEDFLQEFERHPNEEILVITVAQQLSGTCQSAWVAKAESGRQDIYVLDSGSASIGHLILTREAARLRDAGKSAREIQKTLERIKPRLRVYAVLDTLKYLVKGGRLSGAAGALGTILSLKPIILVRDGVVTSCDKARGSRAAIRRLAALTEQEPADRSLPAAFAHSGDLQALAELSRALGIDAPSGWLGSVVGAHTGPGAVAVAYFVKG
jgi:DegV family protein with EDD domain